MSLPPPNPSWQAYAPAFRRDAHQLIAWGYRDALPRIHCDNQEEEITGFIAEAIEDVLLNPSTLRRFDRYSLKDEKPVRGEGRTGKRKRRLDIVIERTGRPRANYIFEAKRLKQSSHPLRVYIGSDGLGRFVTGATYAAGLPEAAMIAYVQNRQPQEWKADLDEAIAPIQLEQSNTVEELETCWFGRHQRTDGTAIEIHHIFLDCTAPSS